MPDPMRERPRYMKKQAWDLLGMAASVAARASTPGELSEEDRRELRRLRQEAGELIRRKLEIQGDVDRATSRPATRHTPQASGAQPGEPIEHFVRALLNALLTLGVGRELAARMVDTGGGQGGEKGNRGKGRKGKGQR